MKIFTKSLTFTLVAIRQERRPGSFYTSMSYEGMQNYSSDFLNVVLVEPEIPTNTGNIGRTCVGTQAHLHLVKPLGFELSDKQLKRAGLDYWPHLKWTVYENLEELFQIIPNKERMFFMTTKTQTPLFSLKIRPGDWFFFGKETKGLNEKLLNQYQDQCLTLPMVGPVRSFNLSNSVSITLFEGHRQLRFSTQ